MKKKVLVSALLMLATLFGTNYSYALAEVGVDVQVDGNELLRQINDGMDSLKPWIDKNTSAGYNKLYYTNFDALMGQAKAIRMETYEAIYTWMLWKVKKVPIDQKSVLAVSAEIESSCNSFQVQWKGNEALRLAWNANNPDDKITAPKNPLPSCSKNDLLIVPYSQCIKNTTTMLTCARKMRGS